MQELQEVRAAIAALALPSSTKEANEFLVKFERSAVAWEVAKQLLQQPNNPIERFFGAKFLYSKITRQFVQLSKDSATQLVPILVQYLLQSTKDQSYDVQSIKYLCLSLAALLLQLDVSGALNQILFWLNPIISEKPHLLLTLLTVLPEECDNSRILVSPETRKSFTTQLSNSQADVMSFLTSSLTQLVSEEDRLAILKCASNWIGLGDSLSLADDLIRFSLLCLQMNSELLFDCSADFLVLVMKRIKFGKAADEAILSNIMHAVLDLRRTWGICLERISVNGFEDEIRDKVFSISKLFTELAEACLENTLSLRGGFPEDEIVLQLLQCAAFKYDHSVARIPLKYFYELSQCIRAHRNQFDGEQLEGIPNSTSNPHNREVLRNRYSPTYSQLLYIAYESMIVDKESDLSTIILPAEKVDSRLEWKETLLDCCDVLGPELCLQQLCSQLEEEIKTGANMNWAKVESLLLSMNFIIPLFKCDSIQYVPQLITLLISFPREITRLQFTSIELLGTLAQWLASNPQYLQGCVAKLLEDMNHLSLMEEASKSVMFICKTSGRLPNFPLQECYEKIVLLTVSQTESVNSQTSLLNLLEGLMYAISSFEDNQAEKYFRAVLQSQSSRLEKTIKGEISDTISKPLDRISVIYKHYSKKSVFVQQTFLEIFPLLKCVLEAFPKESTCEKICRVYKFAVKCSGEHFQQVLMPFLSILYEQFKAITVSAFLYAASVCVSNFAHIEDSKFDPVLYDFLWKISQHFFEKLSSQPDYRNVAELIEEYYYLVSKYLQYSPQLFLQSLDQCKTVFSAAVTIITTLNHREAQKGILLFFQRLVNSILFWKLSDPFYREARFLISNISPTILMTLLSIVAGKVPVYAMDEKDGCVLDVMWDLLKLDKREFEESLRSAVSMLPAEVQLICERQNFVNSLVRSNHYRDFSFIVTNFEAGCLRNL